MSKRNALRIGMNPHDPHSIAFAVERYGRMQQETHDEIVAWLKEQGDAYKWESGIEYSPCSETDVMIPHLIIKTVKKGSVFFKILDNEHDAQNTLANIRNKDFPKNKQGS